MLTLVTIPSLPKMDTSELLKCIFLTVAVDFVILLACINL